MNLIETKRLTLREVAVEDSSFILKLLNEPGFITNIGDRGVRTKGDAETYIKEKVIDSYKRNGFGMYLVNLKETDTPIGLSGLVKRKGLDHVDVGFAFLQEFWNKGYAFESAKGVLELASSELNLKTIVGITNPENIASIRVLEKLGLKFKSKMKLPDLPETNLYEIKLG